MKAVVFHGIGDITLDDVQEPQIEDATDAIVRITTSAICGTDLHIVRGTFPPLASAIEAFDRREPGWVKIKLDVSATAGAGNGRGPRPEASVHVAP